MKTVYGNEIGECGTHDICDCMCHKKSGMRHISTELSKGNRMLRFGKPPYLECSSAGDKRFSAFCAAPRSLDGKSIEFAYQAAKKFADGSTGLHWRKAKGRVAINQEECAALYDRLWREWVEQEKLLPVLKSATGLSDRFGQEGHVCQAEVLWRIRNEAIENISK